MPKLLDSLSLHIFLLRRKLWKVTHCVGMSKSSEQGASKWNTALNAVFALLSSNRGFTPLPLVYTESAGRYTCPNTINLDGHSQKDVSVSVPRDIVRQVTQDLTDKCLSRLIGGIVYVRLGEYVQCFDEPGCL